MIDSQTKTLWSHLLGKAMEGKLRGEQLELIPSVITDWSTWRREHPNTSVLNLSRTAERFQTDFVRDPSKFVLGMADGSARAWPLDQLKKQPVVNDIFDDLPVLVAFDAGSATAWSYDRRVDGRTLEFSMRSDGLLTDTQTGSQWNSATGGAVGGPLKGKTLKPALAIISYRKAWLMFHPESMLWQAEQPK